MKATDAVLKMIDVQRQEQERLLKQLAMGEWVYTDTIHHAFIAFLSRPFQ